MTHKAHDYDIMSACESEAERRLLDAFLGCSTEHLPLLINGGERDVPRIWVGESSFYIGRWKDPHSYWFDLGFYLQAERFGYRVDFAFTGFSRTLIVEVDGKHHDDQRSYDRARDRKLSTMGATVVRVSGSEVASNARLVAVELLNLAHSENRDAILGVSDFCVGKDCSIDDLEELLELEHGHTQRGYDLLRETVRTRPERSK